MLERLVAGILVIGALLWAASTLAIPDAPPEVRDEAAIAPAPSDPADSVAPLPDEPVAPAGGEDDQDEEDDEEEEAPTRERKGKGRGG